MAGTKRQILENKSMYDAITTVINRGQTPNAGMLKAEFGGGHRRWTEFLGFFNEGRLTTDGAVLDAPGGAPLTRRRGAKAATVKGKTAKTTTRKPRAAATQVAAPAIAERTASKPRRKSIAEKARPAEASPAQPAPTVEVPRVKRAYTRRTPAATPAAAEPATRAAQITVPEAAAPEAAKPTVETPAVRPTAALKPAMEQTAIETQINLLTSEVEAKERTIAFLADALKREQTHSAQLTDLLQINEKKWEKNTSILQEFLVATRESFSQTMTGYTEIVAKLLTSIPTKQ